MKYLLVDLEAARLLELECPIEDSGLVIKGYDAYMVEQWACSRASNTVVSSYTGNAANTVTVCSVQVPERELWGPVTAAFMDEISRNHLLTMDIPQGRMFIANMSSFPSNKTLIPIPTSFERGLPFFKMNENLKRLGCTGRLPVSLHSCSDAVGANFYELYKVPSEVPLKFAVREIVTLLQLSLFYCGILKGEYVDGFMCDFTIKAAQEWWQQFGQRSPHVSQHTFMPLTVAAVMGFVFGCNNRLSLLGYKPPKDCFSAHYFINCIHTFQKSERLERTDTLNVATVHRLRDLTAKHVKGPDLITSLKSTVKENLQGKVSAQLMDYETVDMEVLAAVAKGHRAKYLWRASGHQYTPLSSFVSDRFDSKTGIPLYSLADDAAEPKALLRSPRQRTGRNLLRKKGKSVDASAEVAEHQLPSTSTLLTLPNVSAVLFSDEEYPGRRASHAPSNALSQGSGGSGGASAGASASAQGTAPAPSAPSSRSRMSDLQLLTKDDTYKPPSARSHGARRRTQSFSEVEEVVFRWTFPSSVARVSRLYQQAIHLKQEFSQHIDQSERQGHNLRQLLQSQEAELTSESRYSDTINYRITQSTRKEQTVKQQISALEAVTDKLDYQWAFLERQVDEVEKAVEKFHLKLEESQRRWRALEGRKRWW